MFGMIGAALVTSAEVQYFYCRDIFILDFIQNFDL